MVNPRGFFLDSGKPMAYSLVKGYSPPGTKEYLMSPGVGPSGGGYPFQKCLDRQDLFRPLIFKGYHPRWAYVWWPLSHLVDKYEEIERRGGMEDLTIGPGDELKIMMMVERECNPLERKQIENLIRQGSVKKVMADVFCAMYRKVYVEALELARRDFRHSDFLHEWEFFAIKLNLVPRGTRYEKRPPGKLVVELNRIYLHKTKH